MFICDKLKDCLSSGTLQYVLSPEGDHCLSDSKLAASADFYVSNYNEKMYIEAHMNIICVWLHGSKGEGFTKPGQWQQQQHKKTSVQSGSYAALTAEAPLI